MAGAVATLGLVAEYDSIKDATEALDGLGDAAAGAEKGADKFKKEAANTNKETGKLTGGVKNLGGALDKAASAALGGGKQISVFGSLSKGALAAVAAAAAAVTLSMVVAIRRTIEYADKLGDTANMLGVNVVALQEFRFAAERSGIATQTFDVALRRFIRRSSEAAQGTGAAKDAFIELGISLRDTEGNLKDSAILLNEVADAMRGVEDPASKLRIAFKLFDTDGAAMLNMLENGSEGMARLAAEARSLGIVLSEDTVNAAKQVNDNFALVGFAMQGMGVAATNVLAPAILALSEGVASFARGLTVVSSNMDRIITTAATAAVGFGTYLTVAILSTAGAAGVLTAALRLLRAALISTGFGAIIILAGELVYQMMRLREATGSWSAAFQEAGKRIEQIFEGLKLSFNSLANYITAQWHSAMRIIVNGTATAVNSIRTLMGLTAVSFDDTLKDLDGKVEDYSSYAKAYAEDAASAFKEAFKSIETTIAGDGSGGSGISPVIPAGDTLGGALGGAGGGSPAGGGGAANQLEEDLKQRLQTLKEYYASEAEFLELKRLEHLETLELARQAEMLSQQEYNDYKLMVEKEYQQQLQQIKAQEFSSALDATADFFGAMSSLQEGGNEKMLKAQRIFAAASALVNTYMAASQVLADPTLGFFAKFAAVAAVIAKGVALVGAIKSGSSSASSGGGGTRATAPSAAPQEQQRPQQQAVELRMHGEVFSRETVAELIDKINDMGKDGYNVIVRTA